MTRRTILQDLHLWWPSATTAPEPEGAPTCMQQRMCVQTSVCAVLKQGDSIDLADAQPGLCWAEAELRLSCGAGREGGCPSHLPPHATKVSESNVLHPGLKENHRTREWRPEACISPRVDPVYSCAEAGSAWSKAAAGTWAEACMVLAICAAPAEDTPCSSVLSRR